MMNPSGNHFLFQVLAKGAKQKRGVSIRNHAAVTFEVFRAGPARGNQGAAGLYSSPGSLNNFLCSSRTGALGEIGLSGRASGERVQLRLDDPRENESIKLAEEK